MPTPDGLRVRWGIGLQVAILALVAFRPLVDAFVHVRVELGAGSVSLGRAWGALLVALLVAFLAQTVQPRRILLSAVVPAAFVTAYVLLTAFRPGASFAATTAARLVAWILLVFAVQLMARSAEGQARMVAVAQAAALVLVAVIAVQIMQDEYGAAYYDAERNDEFRGEDALHQTPYTFSAFAVFAVPFLLVRTGLGRRRLFALGVVGVLAVCVVLSFVRTTYLAFVLAASPLAVVALRERNRFILAAGGVVLALPLATAALYHETLVERLTQGSGRLLRWRTIGDATVSDGETALVGGGADFSQRVWEAETGIVGGEWSHNDFIEVFATGGVILLALYLLLVAWLFQSFWRLFRDERQSAAARQFSVLALGAFAAFCVLSFVNGIVFSTPMLFLAALAGVARGMYETPGRTFLDERPAILPASVRRGTGPVRSRAEPVK